MLGPNVISHLIGIALVTIAFLVFGRGIVRRSKGKSFNPMPAFLLILTALGYQIFYPEALLTNRIGHLLLDFGVGMVMAAGYLWLNRERAKMFWVPGALGIIAAGVVYLFSFVVNSWGDMRNNPETIELLVELGEDDDVSEIKHILRKYCAHAEQAFPNVDLSEDADLAKYYLVYVDSAKKDPLMMELRNDRENVDQLDLNHPVSLIKPTLSDVQRKSPSNYIANDPMLKNQWYAQSLQYNEVHKMLKGKSPKKKVKVAVVDTGVDKDHEDLGSVYQKSNTDGDYDKHSHGTHCAGLAGAATNNGKGVGSLNWDGEFITLTGYPALDDQGRGTDQRVAKAIIDAAESGADVISMSLGGFAPFGAPKAQVDAIKYARKLGAIVVVAAGNSNDDARKYSPANIKGVITVSAVDEKLNKASFSNTNTKLKMPIAAPGVNILSSVPSSKYQSYNGTSMATPIVAGLVGMLKSFNPDLTTEQVYDILKSSGTKVKDSGKVGKVINPLEALKQVQ
ncbi:MAG: S8 family serine peptidase [Bacteroidota bacterium]